MAHSGLKLPCVCLISGAVPSSRAGTEDGSEEWGYIPVRPGASMFYWFYRTTHPDGYLNRPILFWLQGGPGVPGCGVGNFLMLGPLDENLQTRESTWIQTVNLLLVDYPGDTGFSIVTNSSASPHTMEEVCTDLTSMLQVFMEEHAELQNNPLFIAGQSYGGRTAAALPYYLLRAIETGDLHCNLKGTAIGNGYTSPPDILVNLAPMAYQMSLIDDVQYEQANEYAWAAYFEAENGNWTGYYQYQSKMWETNIGTNVYPYNVLVHPPTSIYSTNIDDFMNGPIKEKLGIIPDDKQYAPYGRAGVSLDDFDLPVWHLVDEVLKTSDVDVIVYSGQFDWICNTAGALRWMEKLTWDGREDFEKAERKLLTNPVTDVAEMFVKSQGQLKMYWVLNSGHVVPNDVPDTAMRMLNRILDDID